MRSAIVLCLLAVFCTVDATLLNILLLQVRNTKWAVESTMRQVELIRDSVKQDVDLTVLKKWLEQIEKHNKYIDPILDTIFREVEDAKARGKNAQSCYDAALLIVRNINYDAYTDAQRCHESAKDSINNNLGFIDHLITIGRGLLEELDNIFPDCYEKNSRLVDIFKLQSCIANQLGISKTGVKDLKTDASTARSTAKYASNIVLKEATDCLNNAYSIAQSKVSEARAAATRCLNSV
ncbi:uncharacterized protein LOC105433284 [Pogonomyrmex barbatus]|uniref:Uncharacterized protein LOC105433284 n=1 Tax=Pogonomyrmex barbatus TaxID=144034 RepID=A0A6I9XLJ1_9HYME|nr:uncharacterized protein LOC105433284 [Pogonomyrmex barbatus]